MPVNVYSGAAIDRVSPSCLMLIAAVKDSKQKGTLAGYVFLLLPHFFQSYDLLDTHIDTCYAILSSYSICHEIVKNVIL